MGRFGLFLLLGGLAATVVILPGERAEGGIVPAGAPVPAPGEAGAPHRPLNLGEQQRFLRGRQLFDKDFLAGAGGGPMLNGDSCRACHQDPVVGGAGGIDVQVQRPLVDDGFGNLVSPQETGELAQTHSIPGSPREEIPANFVLVEERNSPTLLGLGLVQSISDATIRALEDPNDLDGDGIRGIAHILPSGRVGKLGWKANVPDLKAFVRDAMGNEMGVTVPFDPNDGFGFLADEDTVPDPEISQADIDDIVFFLELLDFPPKQRASSQVNHGEFLFGQIGCAKCHVPRLEGVELYSDLLLHDVQPAGFLGVTQGQATSGLYRTAPLRGLRDTAPYVPEDRAETVDQAIRRHAGEAAQVIAAYLGLNAQDRAALLAFLNSL